MHMQTPEWQFTECSSMCQDHMTDSKNADKNASANVSANASKNASANVWQKSHRKRQVKKKSNTIEFQPFCRVLLSESMKNLKFFLSFRPCVLAAGGSMHLPFHKWGGIGWMKFYPLSWIITWYFLLDLSLPTETRVPICQTGQCSRPELYWRVG